MKKTIIALLALGGIAMGATLDDGAAFTSSTYTIDSSWTEGGASVTLLLDVEDFANLFDTATSSARPVFVSMSGSGTNVVGIAAHEGDRIIGATGVVAGDTYDNLYTMSGDDGDSVSTIDWNNVTSAALTMALETSASGTAWSLTVLNSDGTYTSKTASGSGIRFSNMGDITNIAIDTAVVTQAYAFDGFIKGDAAYTLNKAAIEAASTSVPEPTTATLSLLALAGLAARRRRK